MKTVYLVRGSEDDTIGIYTNMKRAYIKAHAYVKGSDIDGSDIRTVTLQKLSADKLSIKNITGSYANVTKDMKGKFSITLSNEDSTFATADIEKYTLNA